MHPRAIIFDMDGTIVDTNSIWDTATTHLLNHCNIVFNGEEEDMFRSRIHSLGTTEICRIIKEISTTQLSVEELVKLKRKIAHDLYESGQDITLIPGFTEFHAKLTAAALKSGVATNADEKTLHITNQKVGLSRFFGTHLYSIKEVNNRCKPNPDIYLHVAEKLELEPKECIAIEDSAHGIAAAQAAGMRCIGINTGNDLRQLQKADLIISAYDDLCLETLSTL